MAPEQTSAPVGHTARKWEPADMGCRPHRWVLRNADGSVALEAVGVELVKYEPAVRLIAAAPTMAAQLAAVDKVLREFEGMTGAGYRYMAANIRKAIEGAAP